MNDLQVAEQVLDLLEGSKFEQVGQLLAPNFRFSGPVPEPLGAEDYLMMQKNLGKAFPDWSFNRAHAHPHGDVIHFTVGVTGTHQGDLDLSEMGMGVIPATGKSIRLPQEELTVRVVDGKVTSMSTSGHPQGGMAGMLGQLGIEMPG